MPRVIPRLARSAPPSRPSIAGSGAIHGLRTARVRLGYVLNSALLYITGGYASAQLSGKRGDFYASLQRSLDQSRHASGLTIELEHALITKASIEASTYSQTSPRRTISGMRDSAGTTDINLLRARLNYQT